jgi:hypothetical protein
MIVQDIVNAVSTDTRQVMNASGNDANVIMNWVDRVQKDVLHTTLYANQNIASTQVTTVVGQNAYTMSPPSAIRRIISIFDLTFNMSLTPSDVDLDSPTPVATRVNEEAGRSSSQINQPHPSEAYRFGGTAEYFRFIGPNTLVIRPAPATPGYVATLSVVYEQLVPTLSSLTAALIVPDDGKDVVCAGVNWMAFAYIGRQQEAASWFQLYQQLKQGNRIGVLR